MMFRLGMRYIEQYHRALSTEGSFKTEISGNRSHTTKLFQKIHFKHCSGII